MPHKSRMITGGSVRDSNASLGNNYCFMKWIAELTKQIRMKNKIVSKKIQQ